MHTVIGAFDDRAQAERAVERLVADGFDRSDVHVEAQQAMGGASATQSPIEERPERRGFFAWLFGDDEEQAPRRAVYGEAVRRGSSVVVVDAQDETQAERAVSCLHELGAVDVDERARQWRQEGWSDRERMAGDDKAIGREGVLDVVQEELQIGKRQFDKGGVRVVQRVSQKPVREVVRLREEEAVVERRPVDRAATAGEMEAFREGTLEVRETAEEPVVAKTARVVEEVRVGKQVREREQVVEDSVRRKDVEVERMDATRDRERAVASDAQRVRGTTTDPQSRDTLRDDDRPLSDRDRSRDLP